MGNTVKVGIESFRGADGFSPTITAQETASGVELTITDL